VSEAAVDRLIASSEAFIAALDAHDIEAIESTLPAFGESVTQLRSSGDWQRSPELSARLERALALADAARARIRFLADNNRQQIDLFATAAGRFDCTPATYGRRA
jgi:hypothetical protein